MSDGRHQTQQEPHVHEWQANGTATEERYMASPVSTMDDQVQTVVYAIQSCVCGKVKRTAVSAGPVRWLNRGRR